MAVTPAQLVTALQDWGVTVKAYEPDGKRWHSHTTPGGWSAVGIMHHHTAGSSKLLTDSASQAAMLRLLRVGRIDSVARATEGVDPVLAAEIAEHLACGFAEHHGLDVTGARTASVPGPLCHLAPAMIPGTSDARVWLIGWGNVNHGGMGSSRTLNAVKVGKYAGAEPVPGGADVDTNPWYWGLEYMHPGTTPTWPDALLEAGHRAACAICEAQGWSVPSWPGSNVEHRESTSRKIDRSWRGDLRAAIRDTIQGGKDMALSDADKKWITDLVEKTLPRMWKSAAVDVIPIKRPELTGNPANTAWQPDSVLSRVLDDGWTAIERLTALGADTAAIRAVMTQLTEAVGTALGQLTDITNVLDAIVSNPGGLEGEQLAAVTEQVVTRVVDRLADALTQPTT